jgi:hypothetical protein
MLAIACQCSVFARQTEVGHPPPFPAQSFFPPERRFFQRRVDCHLSKRARNIRRHAVPLAAKATSGHCRHTPASETQGNALTRNEHLAWCKRRALEYVDAGDLTHAVAIMASDLKTHPDTDNPALNGLIMIGMMYAKDGDKAAVQRWIELFR